MCHFQRGKLMNIDEAIQALESKDVSDYRTINTAQLVVLRYAKYKRNEDLKSRHKVETDDEWVHDYLKAIGGTKE